MIRGRLNKHDIFYHFSALFQSLLKHCHRQCTSLYYFIRAFKCNGSLIDAFVFRWSNYTECQRLIYVTDSMLTTARYLLGCDAVDCCYEEQTGNQIEFQSMQINSKVMLRYL
jgi:hypothetical protein